MLETKLVFDDGTILRAGTDGNAVIKSVNLTEAVNSGEELTLGSVCSAILEAQIITYDQSFAPAAGQQVTLYRDDVAMGVFLLDKPTRLSASILKLTAYDFISKLDKDLSGWLTGLAGWPYSLHKFAQMVCTQCDLELENSQIPNGDYSVEKFAATGITGRQLLQWVGEACGRFCRATPEGRVRFGWYEPGEMAEFCYEGSFHYEDYSVTPIDAVQIRTTAEDVGICFPETGGSNPYQITGNLLLTGQTGRLAVAQTLYSQLESFTYTPCRITVPASTVARAGQILQYTGRTGIPVRFLVMKRTQQGQRDSLACTGSASRQSASAVNHQSFHDLSGKVMELQVNLDGLRLENRQAAQQSASLALDVDGIRSQVSGQSQELENQNTRLTSLEQNSESLRLAVQSVQEEGASKVVTTTGFTFDERGLTVEKTGSDMQNRIDQTGMHILRGGTQTLLRAAADGVLATDVTVENYLVVGNHARFEQYTGGRVACYYTGG